MTVGNDSAEAIRPVSNQGTVMVNTLRLEDELRGLKPRERDRVIADIKKTLASKVRAVDELLGQLTTAALDEAELEFCWALHVRAKQILDHEPDATLDTVAEEISENLQWVTLRGQPE
jgi:hypothetical protein